MIAMIAMNHGKRPLLSVVTHALLTSCFNLGLQHLDGELDSASHVGS